MRLRIQRPFLQCPVATNATLLQPRKQCQRQRHMHPCTTATSAPPGRRSPPIRKQLRARGLIQVQKNNMTCAHTKKQHRPC